jgi:hypothetical protein
MERSYFKKIIQTSRWYDHPAWDQNLRVGVRLVDPTHGILYLSNEQHEDPLVRIGELLADRLPELDADPNVESWSILRKAGDIHFSDDTLWQAYVSHHAEFNPYGSPINQSREEYQREDPLGYSELMGAWERILYQAVGYY